MEKECTLRSNEEDDDENVEAFCMLKSKGDDVNSLHNRLSDVCLLVGLVEVLDTRETCSWTQITIALR